MTIELICTCGQRLQAREEMAERWTVCPACRALVTMPSLRPPPAKVIGETASGQPPVPGGPASVDRDQIYPFIDDDPARPKGPGADSGFFDRERHPPDPADLALVRMVFPRQSSLKQRSRRSRSTRQANRLEYLVYPFRLRRRLLKLTAALTILIGGFVALLPGIAALRTNPVWPWPLLYVVVPILVLGYACGFLERVLADAASWEARLHRPGRDPALALLNGSRWLICFLAGPVVPAGAGCLYWFYGGDLALVDWVIVAELSVAAMSYWLLLLLAINESGHLREARPRCVSALVERLGSRLVIAVLVASVLLLADGWWMLSAFEEILHGSLRGWFLLAGCWLGGLYVATVLFRLVGLWFFNTRGVSGGLATL
jgi:hypothetical protein